MQDRANLEVKPMAQFEAGIEEYVRRVQRALAALPTPETPDDHREQRETLSEIFAFPYPETFSVADRYIHAPGRLIPIRIYRPKDRVRGPAILFFHGGGFVSGSIHTHDVYALGIAESAKTQVISVNYRLAPENPYPAAIDDCYFALCWMAENADRLGIDGARIAVGGDSAGGNLAAACALMARDKKGPKIKYQYLIFPMLDTAFDTASYIANTEDPFLSREDCITYWRTYLQDDFETPDVYAAPMRTADLSDLPPAYILTAEHDPLRDDGERYGERLIEAGVEATIRRAPGTIHGFVRARFTSLVAEEEVEALGSAIRGALEAD